MGILSILIKKNARLKIILMSATIDTQQFSVLFPHYAVIHIPGKMYPVDSIFHWDVEYDL